MPGSQPQFYDQAVAERRRTRSGAAASGEVRLPEVKLGPLVEGGLAPAILAIVERGTRRRPALARAREAEVELSVREGYLPVRIAFEEGAVLVEDGPAIAPRSAGRWRVGGSHAAAGSPEPGGGSAADGRPGRSAVAMVASRRIRVSGRIGLLRRFLSVIRI